jgi:cysteine desulfurase/selenocysteine lyase
VAAFGRADRANVHRGVYRVAAEATARFEGARETTRAFLNAASPREIVFTRGTTEAVNLVAYSWGRANLGPGDVVVTSVMEHHSNFVPWQQIAQAQGATLRAIPITTEHTLDLDALADIERQGGRVKLVAVGHISNSLGTVNPVRELADWAHERDALLFVDGAQAAPHRAIDVQALGCDFYAFSAHKLPGPTGIGALWGREAILTAMQPFNFGGEMIRRVELEQTTFNDLPWKFEAGTPAIVEAVGMAAAMDYLTAIGVDAVHAHEQQLTAYGFDLLGQIPGLTLLGPPRGIERGGILSFTIDGTHPHDIATVLDDLDVNIRAGHHCTQPLMKALGTSATARASVYLYNTTGDLDRLAAGVDRVREMFKLA